MDPSLGPKYATGIFLPSLCAGRPLRIPTRRHKNKRVRKHPFTFLVGVSGFEPEASWTRTKRDTKLRHTPLAENIIMNFACLVKCSRLF